MSTNTTDALPASSISPTDPPDHTLELTMQPTADMSRSTTVQVPDRFMTPSQIDAKLRQYRRAAKHSVHDWDPETPSDEVRQGDDYNYLSPQNSSVKKAIRKAAKSYYEPLAKLSALEYNPRFFFRELRRVREAKKTLRSTDGYNSLTTDTRGRMENDEKRVISTIFAHSCNVETGGSICESLATEQARKDYFEIEDTCSVPPVCASGICSDPLADKCRNGKNSLASIAYPLCSRADPGRITDRREIGHFAKGCEGQRGRGKI